MEEEKKESESVQVTHKKINLTEKFRENPWILTTLICGVLSIVLLVWVITGGITGNVISKNQVGEKLLEYYTTQGVTGLTLNSVKDVSGIYEVDFNYNDGIVPMYVTKDGTLVGSLSEIDLTGKATSNPSSSTTEVPKTDRPTVELYVFTYCPYGTQMEKAMIPAIKLLKDKIDFKIRQIGAMHGDYEKVEAERQLCIEKNYPDKFLDYVLVFAESTEIGSCSGDATCLVPKLNALYAKFGIDSSKINSCMASEGETLYNAEVSNANSKGVSGSPTLIINGVNAQASRSPEGVKGVICEAFNNVPSECSQTLSTSQSSAGFGSGTGSSSSSASC